MSFKLSDTVFALSLVSLGGVVSVSFISMGYFEPIISGLIAFVLGVVISQFSGVIKYFGYGLVAGAVGTLVYYYIPRSMASSVQDLRRF